MLGTWLKRLILLSVLSCGPALGQTTEQPRVFPPPGSGLSAPQSSALTFDPSFDELPEPEETKSLLEESLAEAIEGEPLIMEGPFQWYEPVYWFGPAPWDIGIEFGLNGSHGINESLSINTGGHLKRKTKHWKLDTSLTYNKNSSNDVETQNNGLIDARIDRRMKESPWSLYFLHQTLYDEFQAYDLRVSANAGVGYMLVDTKSIEFIGRFGSGTSREFGGPDNSWVAEALFGFGYEHELTKTQRFSATVDYYPEWDQFNDYRIVSDSGWEIDLDQPKNLSLKFSVVDRYDSTPNGVQPNELNYSALLIWGL